MEETKDVKLSEKGKGLYIPSYFTESTYRDDIDAYQTILELYSISCYLRKVTKSKLRRQLVNLLSLYLKEGYSRETKRNASVAFGIDMKTINCMNKELTDNGYLVVSDKNPLVREKVLNDDLIALKDYIDTAFTSEKPSLYFTFVLHASK